MHTLHIYHLLTEYRHDIIVLPETVCEHCMVLNSNEVESIGIDIVFTRSINTLCCDVRYDFRAKNDVRFVLTPCLCKGFMFYFCYLYLLTYTGVQHGFHIR